MPPRHYLQWHILHPCNLHCLHCYQEDTRTVMPWPQMQSALDKYTAYLAAHNYEGQINLTGGEPLLHPDFMRLSREIRARGLRLGILTNGTLIDDRRAADLASLAPIFVQVSLDGPQPIHDRIRGEGNYARAMRGIDFLKKHKVRVLVSFTAMKCNHPSFAALALACRRHHVDKLWWDRVVTDDPTLYLTTDEFRSLTQTAARLARRYPFIHNDRSLQWLGFENQRRPLILKKPLPAPTPYHCSAGKHLLVLLATGDLMPCRRLPFVIGNIDDTDDLARLIDNNPLMRSLAKPSFPEKCVKCDHFPTCKGGARCVTYAQTGRLDAPDINCYC